MINLNKKPSNLNKKAFSLIELSIVILIIGIIVAGITQSSRLIRQFKLSTARSLTQSSPVASIKDLSMWIEATSIASFDDAETEDANVVTAYISNWYDINPTSSVKRNATANALNSTRPQRYENCINSLPCVRFAAATSTTLNFDGSFLAGSDYTIFVVEQRRLAAALYFIGNSTAPSANNAIGLGYSATSAMAWSQGSLSNMYTVGGGLSYALGKIDAYTTPSPRLSSFVNSTIASGTATFNHYMNGSSTASTKADVGTPALGTLASYPNGSIGSSHSGSAATYFTGDIGEIIIFTRALKAEERVAVEDYLLKKWGIAGL